MRLQDDDSALLSIDFLAGFTVFLLAFIVAASMVPGMLASLQSSTIDYDAVAYRTGVILVEDPGWWFDDVTMMGHTNWQGEQTATDRVQRMGLALSKETPGVLSTAKADRFFDRTAYEADPDYYTSRVFFSEYPYSFNISLKPVDSTDARTLGTPVPRDTTDYGSIRRMVTIKESGPLALDLSNATTRSAYTSGGAAEKKTFAVRMNFSKMLEDPVAYRVDPFGDEIEIRLEHLDTLSKANLTSVRLYRGGVFVPPPLPDDYSVLSVDGVEIGNPAAVPVDENITLLLEPGFFTGRAQPSSIMEVRFAFENLSGLDWTYLNTTCIYDDVVTSPSLEPAVLEVDVW